MLKGIQNLDATLIEEAEFGTFQENRAGISGKKKLLFLLAATLIMGTMTAAAVYTRWSTTAQTRYNPSQDIKEQAEKSGLSVMLEETKGAENSDEVLSVTDQGITITAVQTLICRRVKILMYGPRSPLTETSVLEEVRLAGSLTAPPGMTRENGSTPPTAAL